MFFIVPFWDNIRILREKKIFLYALSNKNLNKTQFLRKNPFYVLIMHNK